MQSLSIFQGTFGGTFVSIAVRILPLVLLIAPSTFAGAASDQTNILQMREFGCHAKAGVCKGDAVINGRTLTCSTSAPFKQGMVGWTAVVFDAGPQHAALNTTISTVLNSSTATLGASADSASATPVWAAFGIDDQACLKAAYAKVKAAKGGIVKFEPGNSYFFHNFDTSGVSCGGNPTILCDGTANHVTWDIDGATLIAASGNRRGATLFETGGLDVPTATIPIKDASPGDKDFFTTTARDASEFGIGHHVRICGEVKDLNDCETNTVAATNPLTGEVKVAVPLGKPFNTGTPKAIDEESSMTLDHQIIDSLGTGSIYVGQQDHFNIVQNVDGFKWIHLNLFPMHPTADVGLFWNNVNNSELAFNTIVGTSCRGPWVGIGNAGSAHGRAHNNRVAISCAKPSTIASSGEGGEDATYDTNNLSVQGNKGSSVFDCSGTWNSSFTGNTGYTSGFAIVIDNGATANYVAPTNCRVTGNTFHGVKDTALIAKVGGDANGDWVTGNVFDAPRYVQFQFGGASHVMDNKIHCSNCNGGTIFNLRKDTRSLQSEISGNTIVCDSGNATAFFVPAPDAECTSCTLALKKNVLVGIMNPIRFGDGAEAKLPKRSFEKNTGVKDFTPHF